MTTLENRTNRYRDQLVALSACVLVALALAFGLLPRSAAAHHFNPTGGITVDCVAGTVSVSVVSWAGHIRITNNDTHVAIDKPASGTQTVVFTIAEIGGSGHYTANRPEDTSVPQTDPVPKDFTVACGGSLSLTKTADAATVSAGSQIGYTITVHNGGPGTSTAVSVSDSLPGGTGISWTINPAVAGCSIAGSAPQKLVCNYGDLANGAGKAVHVVSATTADSCKTYDNTAKVTSTNNADVTSGKATTTVQCATVSVNKTADAASVSAGSQIGFTVTVHNAGPGVATGASLSDTLPGGSGILWSISPAAAGCSITGTGPQVLGCTFGDLASGASRTVHVVSDTTAASCKVYDNSAKVSASNMADVTSQTASTTVQCPDVSVSKTADAASVSAGSQIGFTITVHNAGPGMATSASLSDTLPSGSGILWSISPAAPGCSITGTGPQVLGCAFGDLAGGASKSVHVVSGTTANSCATYDNSAKVSGGNMGDVTSPTATTTVQCPHVTVAKTADAASVSAGSQIGFTITVSNAGPGNATSVTLSDPLPGGSGISWSIDPATAGCSITGTVSQALSCTFGDLASGASKSVHVVSGTTTASCATYDNSAKVSGGNMGDATSPTATTNVTCPAGGVLGVSTPAGGVLGASTHVGGVLGASITSPRTGHSGLLQSLMVALAMVVLGAAVLTAQALRRSAGNRKA